MLTILDIQKQLKPAKNVTLQQVRNYIKRCQIRHLGARQRPQQYADDTPDIILRHLGLNGQNGRKAA